MAIAVSLKGLDGIMVAVNKTIAEAEAGTIKALDKFQSNVVADAKRAAPANEGNLRNSISGSVTGTQAKVVVTANYAAYLEFGTRKFAAAYVATLPPDWQTYAATFKGKGGGTWDQFIKDIMQWVRAKGIGGYISFKTGKVRQSKDSLARQEQDAYVIARSILINGIRPQPFLFPAVQKHTPALITDIKKVFE